MYALLLTFSSCFASLSDDIGTSPCVTYSITSRGGIPLLELVLELVGIVSSRIVPLRVGI